MLWFSLSYVVEYQISPLKRILSQLNVYRIPTHSILMVELAGFEPASNIHLLKCNTTIFWQWAEESNPIRVSRTWFSRPVAGPTPLHYSLFYLAKVTGLEPILRILEIHVRPLHYTLIWYRVNVSIIRRSIISRLLSHWANSAYLADSIGFEPMRHFRNDSLANCSLNLSGNHL